MRIILKVIFAGPGPAGRGGGGGRGGAGGGRGGPAGRGRGGGRRAGRRRPRFSFGAAHATSGHSEGRDNIVDAAINHGVDKGIDARAVPLRCPETGKQGGAKIIRCNPTGRVQFDIRHADLHRPRFNTDFSYIRQSRSTPPRQFGARSGTGTDNSGNDLA